MDATPVVIYQFLHELNTEKKKDEYTKEKRVHILNGACTVYDAYHNKTHYEYDANHRLTHLDKFHANGMRYTRESLFWGTGQDESCLKTRTLEANGQNVFARTYLYDANGNVLQDKLYGNLSGNNGTAPLVVNGEVLENGCECYSKQCTYSDDGRNLLLSETDGVQKICYIYLPGTSRLIAKLQGDQRRWYRRWFYCHNDDGAVVWEMNDDGYHTDFNDLTGVTERHITYYTYTENYPIAYPAVIEEKCLDLPTRKEISLHKVMNTYTSLGQVSQQAHYDSQGTYCYTLFWEYDAMGNITKEVDALGSVIIRKYDANSNCVYEQGPRTDCYMQFTYDYMNRLIKEEEVHPDGILSISHRYDVMSHLIATIDQNGNETKYACDPFGRVIQTTLPPVLNESLILQHPVITKSYDPMGHTTQVVDGKGLETNTLYTLRGQPAHIFYPDGTSEHKIYHPNGTLKESIAKNGTISRYSNDALGRVLKTEIYSAKGELLSTTSATYTGFQIQTETDAMGLITRYAYTADGKLKSKHRSGYVTSYEYDSLNRLIATKEGGMIKAQQYDFLNRVIEESVRDEQGNTLTYIYYCYDEMGNVSQQITENGIIKTSYNSHGVPLVTDALGNKTITRCRYDFYNGFGQRVPYQEVTDPLGNITITIQNPLERIVHISKKNAFGKVIQQQEFTYDMNGNQAIISDFVQGRMILTLMTYDSTNKLTACYEAVATPEQKATKFFYNSHGQKQEIIKPDGIHLSHTFDPLGRLSSLTSSDGTIHYHYHYDRNHNPTCVEDQIHHTKTQKKFDIYNRIISETQANGLAISYTYDSLNRPIQITLPDHSRILYKYQASFLSSIERQNPQGNSLYIHKYLSYDQSGHITKSQLIANAGTIDYQYDSLSRVTKTNTQHYQEQLCYDAAGNLIKKELNQKTLTFSYDDLYQVTQEEGHQYTYDSHYNRLSKDNLSYRYNSLHQLLYDGTKHYSYDLNGNLIQKDSTTFHYDALDRLIAVATDTKTTHYTYDENNRRLSKDNLLFLYQGENEIGSYSNGQPIELRLLGTGKGAEIGAAISLEINETIYAPIHDHTGSLVALLDTQGNLVESYSYTAFGEAQFENALSPWLFASKRYDPESGFIYFGRRYYDPSIGRWITPDPIGREGGPNLYVYLLNNPLTHFDLYGLFGFDDLFNFVSDVFSLPGKTIEMIGHHFTPIPFVKDMIEFGGWCLAGKNPTEYIPDWKRDHSQTWIHEGNQNFDPHLRHVLFSGVGVTFDEFKERCADLSKHYGGVSIYGVYNATHGFILDIFECIIQKLGIPNHNQVVAERSMRKIVDDMGDYKHHGTLITWAHSQGTETVHNLSPDLKKMMCAYGVGSARFLFQKDFKEAYNFVSPLDPVMLTDPFGLLKGIIGGNINFVQPKGCPLMNHAWNGKTYSRIYETMGEKFKAKYATVN